MDGARNMLLSTCKERNLRKKDPNVEDENHTFLGTTADIDAGGSGSLGSSTKKICYWRDQSDTQRWLTHTSYRPSTIFGTRVMFSQAASFMYQEDNAILQTIDPSKNLYIRFKLYHIMADGVKDDYVFYHSLMPDGSTHLKLGLRVVDPNSTTAAEFANRYAFAEWSDIDGVVHVLECKDTLLLNNNQFELKFFLYHEKMQIEVTPYRGDPVMYSENTNYIPSAEYGKVILGADRENPTKQQTFNGLIFRVGYGNDINTRPPVPD